jgi:hypothetical protein
MALCAAVHLLSAFLPSVVVNMPLNDVLGAIVQSNPAADATQAWLDYSPRWTWWATLRPVACAVSTVASSASRNNASPETAANRLRHERSFIASVSPKTARASGFGRDRNRPTHSLSRVPSTGWAR